MALALRLEDEQVSMYKRRPTRRDVAVNDRYMDEEVERVSR